MITKTENNTVDASSRAEHGSATVDALIADLEARGLGWSLDSTGTGRLIEARVWDWPRLIGRYRPNATEPLAKMLAEAMAHVDWTRYPVKSSNAPELKVLARAHPQNKP